MKSRCLLSSVDRLPTISELQEAHAPHQDQDEYLDSIKELSQPACFPLHGPLRGRRPWRVRGGPVAPPLFLNAPWLPVDPSDVSFTLTGPSGCDPSVKQNLLDMLTAQSQFEGLV
ncbi:uncharacterized protein si:ch73-6k14.2 [Gambusia affinis]|uniref:uncharacterized protein si:ch73-6k14.2 n=1 Tax=Gambusia affinis TaxID=33528 RepID=UPI001CDD7551|nr:uncharacterized protein si:ch73-6k14.2 [Gambusia affinis]